MSVRKALKVAEKRVTDADHLTLVARAAIVGSSDYDTDDPDIRGLVVALEMKPVDWKKVEYFLDRIEQSNTPKEFVAVAAEGSRPPDFEDEIGAIRGSMDDFAGFDS